MDAVIFDFDGVVVDSEHRWDPLMEELCGRLIPSWNAGDNARLLTGANLRDNYACLKEVYGVTFTWEEWETEIERLTDRIYGEETQPIPGVVRLLSNLRDENVPIGLASSSKAAWIERALTRLNLASFFPHRATGDNLKSGQGKPAPYLYLKAAQMLKVDPAHCVAIEDSRNGSNAAVAAGMCCIGLRNGANELQDLTAAHVVLDDLGALDVEMLRSIYEDASA